jgi:uncharacterized protein (UPF0276 family)
MARVTDVKIQDLTPFPVQGVGLGLRRGELMRELEAEQPGEIAFLEVAPENWLSVGGALGKRFRALTERFPFVCHGLSLSIGGPAPLDEAFVRQVGAFMDRHGIRAYTEHLTYCGDEGHLYDLMPIPFTEEAVDYVAARIRRVQDLLGRRIGMENASYYAAPGAEMSELEFVTAVLERADCDLLLDVNNAYVNSINHGYDPRAYILGLPRERIVYAHIAGHYEEAPDLRVDTHGSDVIDPVWELLDWTYAQLGVFPTLLERDFNIPPLAELRAEVRTIANLQTKHATGDRAVAHG